MNKKDRINSIIKQINSTNRTDKEVFFLTKELLIELGKKLTNTNYNAINTLSVALYPILKNKDLVLSVNYKWDFENPIIKGEIYNYEEKTVLYLDVCLEKYNPNINTTRDYIININLKSLDRNTNELKTVDCDFYGNDMQGKTQLIIGNEDELGYGETEENTFKVRFDTNVIKEYDLKSNIRRFDSSNNYDDYTYYELNMRRFNKEYIIDETVYNNEHFKKESSVRNSIEDAPEWQTPNIPLFTNNERIADVINQKISYKYKPEEVKEHIKK